MAMSNAAVTIVGRAGTHPQLSVGMTGDRVNFRVVANERWFDKATERWVDGDEFGVTVVCWKALASAVLNGVRKGDPVVVSGRILTRRFEKNGATQYFTEVKADFVGMDLAKLGSRFTRNQLEPRDPAEPAASGNPTPPDSLSVDGEPVEPTGEEDFDAEWDAETGGTSGRDEELVSVE
jgi:single-strand DNA-binding protein